MAMFGEMPPGLILLGLAVLIVGVITLGSLYALKRSRVRRSRRGWPWAAVLTLVLCIAGLIGLDMKLNSKGPSGERQINLKWLLVIPALFAAKALRRHIRKPGRRRKKKLVSVNIVPLPPAPGAPPAS